MTAFLLLGALGLTGCFQITDEDIAAAKDLDGDGDLGEGFGGNDCSLIVGREVDA